MVGSGAYVPLCAIHLHNAHSTGRFKLTRCNRFCYQLNMAESEKAKLAGRPRGLGDVRRWLGEDGARSAAAAVLRARGFSLDSDCSRGEAREALAAALTAAEDWLEGERQTESREAARRGLREARRLVEG
jgi:hypothetical protein